MRCGHLSIRECDVRRHAICRSCSQQRDTGFVVNVVTSEAPSSLRSEALFVSRMFAPGAGVPEDHVCGSAHCLSGPYWAAAKGLMNTPISAMHVSERGGKLGLTVEERTIKLRGEVKTFAKGQMTL